MAARRAAEKAAREGGTTKRWDGFRWVEVEACAGSADPSTRNQRRLYIGNLPVSLDSQQLKIFINEALRACGAVTEGGPDPVLSSDVAADNKYAFVELGTVDAANTALGLNGINCMGSTLKITNTQMGSQNGMFGAFGSNTPALQTMSAPQQQLQQHMQMQQMQQHQQMGMGIMGQMGMPMQMHDPMQQPPQMMMPNQPPQMMPGYPQQQQQQYTAAPDAATANPQHAMGYPS